MSSKKSPIRILVVDDFKPWLGFVKTTLSQEPDMQIVGTALDGPEAVAKARDLRPDVILMDVNLPTLKGVEAARKISRSVHESKIIFVSVENDSELVKAALAAGGRGYVVKSDADTELVSAIKAVVHGERYVSRTCRSSL